MKKILLSLLIVLCSLSLNAATGPLASQILPPESSITEELVKLFSSEALKNGSPINKLITNLRNDPENESHHIEDFITNDDIIFIESFGQQDKFEMKYLIILRAGFKSSNTPVVYLRGVAFSNSEDEEIQIQISGPIKVEIE